MVEVELEITDYHNLMNWYELAFGRKSPKDIKDKDHQTFRKLAVMAQAKVEEEKRIESEDSE